MDPENTQTAVLDAPSESEWGFSPDSPLVSLGLVDPATGKAVDGNTPAEAEVTETPATPAAPTIDWESDANPYKQASRPPTAEAERDPAETAHQTRDQQLQTVRNQAQMAYNQMTTVGIDGRVFQPAEAQAYLTLALQNAEAKINMEAERAVLLPAARRMTAEQIAKQYSLPNAEIKADELEGETSVDAMKARARTLQETRRGQKFEARKTEGRDAVEGGAPSGTALSEAIDKLGPTEKIALGIARGL